MIVENMLPLVNWVNGYWLIGLFALVCIILVVAVLAMVSSGKKSDQDPTAT